LRAFSRQKAGATDSPTPRRTGHPIIPLDVCSDESVRAALVEVRSRAGRLDVLVNNAGLRPLGAVEETSVD
jgi:NAD(P)-dependent dehydrogenase (short-subunit alcohol dehydrogenase family)